jgi:hypothetical protein
MATKTPTKRTTAQSIRESAKRDPSPKWEGSQEWSGEQFSRQFRFAMDYYRMETSIKDLKPKIIEWMTKQGYDKNTVSAFKKTKDSRCSMTVAAVAACQLKGMPEVHPAFNKGRNTAEWLKTEIAKIIEQGQNDVDETEGSEAKTPKTAESYSPTIQDRLRETAGQMNEEIDYAIDSWISDPESFDPKAFKMVSLLRGKGAKAAHARIIKSFYLKGQNELLELAGGNPNDQLREAYRHVSRRNVKKLIEFYASIMAACDQIAAEAKVLKKPRAKKVKPAEELVSKLKFKAIDDKLGVVSVPAAGIIGAQAAVVYNSKTRKLGIYIAKSSAGLNVKGTSIIDFTEKSFQKTLRKPAEQIKEFKEQNTQKRAIDWFSKIKSTDTILNGRINAEVMILKVYK